MGQPYAGGDPMQFFTPIRVSQRRPERLDVCGAEGYGCRTVGRTAARSAVSGEGIGWPPSG
jgi:hypothetical protein